MFIHPTNAADQLQSIQHLLKVMWAVLTLSGAGGGGGEKHPPTFVLPRKKLMGKVANFFVAFPKYRNGRLGTTF